MNNDLIKRNLAISYATSGLVRRIDGEEWIRISEVKQSLNDAPTVPVLDICKDCNSKSYDIGFNAGYEAGKTDALRKMESVDEEEGGAE